MNKCYYRINNGDGWENYPSDKTPVNKANLDKGDIALDEIDNRVIVLDNTKATKVEVSTLIKEVSLDERTGIVTFTRKNGATFTIDTPMEKIQTGIYYDPKTEKLAMPLIDGTTIEVDLSRLITEFEFLESNTIAFSVSDGKVKAIIKEGSVEEKHLRPDYLADIKVEVAKAQSSATSAESSKNAAASSASTASAKALEAATSATNAAESATTATQKATDAETSATNASNSAASADASATTATNNANAAATSATNAANSESVATNKANAASASAANADTSAANADTYAKQAQSYAVGTSGVRPNETTDNAKYYYEQSRDISQGLAGALMPMGTVTFANLPALANAESGWMYNISDQFTTTTDFKEGAGNIIPAGSNVYKTADGKWDVLAGSPVTGVKGDSENGYRKGNVNITKANIGLGNVGNFKAVSTVASQGLTNVEKSNARTNIGAGTSSFSGDYNDLSNKPTIPAAVAVKGNAETSYRTGNVNLTAENVGAMATDSVLSGSPVVSDYIFPPFTAEIVHIATLTINNGRKKGLNSPIVIELSISGFQKSHTLYIQFDYQGTGTMLLHSFTYSGPKSDNRFYIRNSDNNGNEWNLFVSMDGSPLNGDGCVSVLMFSNPNNQHASGAINISRIYCSAMNLEQLPPGTDYKFEWLSAKDIGAVPDSGGTLIGTLVLGNTSIANSSRLEWQDSKRRIWASTANEKGSWYLWDATNNRAIIISNLDGTGIVYGGNKAAITTDGEGGNLRLFSPDSKVSGEIDCYNNKSTRWYAADMTNNSVPCSIVQSIENQSIVVSCLKNLDLKAGTNYGVRVIDQSNGWGQISAADFHVASSRRYKENIQPMTEEKAKTLLDVEIVTFDYKDGVVGKNPLDRSGVIAEDTAEIIPEAVGYITEDDEEIPDSVDYSKFVPYLIKMVQIQQNEIDRLKLENAALDDRLAKIEAAVEMG